MTGYNGRLRVSLAGGGAFGTKHLDALSRIENAEVAMIVGRRLPQTQEVATRYGVPHATIDLNESLGRDDIDAVILATPTQLHAAQAVAAMRAGKHVQVEIPLADNWHDAYQVAAVQRETGLVCMVGHTRRFNPSHTWLHRRVQAGEFTVRQLNTQTYFLRRSNLNARNEPRSWTDHLLWHHAAHTVDLFRYQTGEDIAVAHALAGPPHPELGIAMDMSVQLRGIGGAICTLALSFNNDGPFGSDFRYIGDTGTYLARYDNLYTGHGAEIDLAGLGLPADGIEAQDREFLAAIREGREPNSSVTDVLPCYRTLADLDQATTNACLPAPHGRSTIRRRPGAPPRRSAAAEVAGGTTGPFGLML
jgi:2-hydroxy-4-carboxymuconate semialdehyde hemiacetal dehydrogenase